MHRLLAPALALAVSGCTVRWHATDGAPIQGPASLPDIGTLEGCGADSVPAIVACVERERLAADVSALARPRPAGSEQWNKTRAACADRLRQFGFAIEQQSYGTGTNVIGRKVGVTRADEEILVSAHYDHIEACPGADDNASGLAALFELARVLGPARFDRTLVVACWDEHERGLRGSTAYVERAVGRSERILAAVVLDAIGYTSSRPGSQAIPGGFERSYPDLVAELDAGGRRGDFLALLGDPDSRELAARTRAEGSRVGLKSFVLSLDASARARHDEATTSDHESFWLEGFPALLATDTGSYRNPHRRCREGEDVPADLDFDFLERVTQAIAGALTFELGVRQG